MAQDYRKLNTCFCLQNFFGFCAKGKNWRRTDAWIWGYFQSTLSKLETLHERKHENAGLISEQVILSTSIRGWYEADNDNLGGNGKGEVRKDFEHKEKQLLVIEERQQESSYGKWSCHPFLKFFWISSLDSHRSRIDEEKHNKFFMWERLLGASWDRGGVRANFCLFVVCVCCSVCRYFVFSSYIDGDIG